MDDNQAFSYSRLNGSLIRSNRMVPYIIIGAVMLVWALFYNFLPWYISIFFPIAFFSFVIFLINPEIAVYALTFMVPIFGNRLGFYFDFTHIGLKSSKTIPLFLLFLAAGAAALFVRRASKYEAGNPFSNPLPVLASAFLLIYALFSLEWAPYYYYGRVVTFFILLNFVLYYFVCSLINNETMHRRIMISFILSGVVIAVLTILSFYQIPKKTFYFKYFTDSVTFIFNNLTEVKYRGHALGHPNHTSLTLNLATFAAFGLLLYENSKKMRVFLISSIMVMIFANILTGSKGGVGSFLLALIFLAVCSSVSRKHLWKNIIVWFLIIVGLLLLSFTYTSSRRTPRLMKVSYRGETVSLKTRIEMWKAGKTELQRKHLMLIGLGPGGFEKTTEYPHAHNHILSFYFDFGIPGLLFALFLYLSFAVISLKFLKSHWVQTNYLQVMCIALISGMIAIAIHGTVDHYYAKSVIWLFLAFTAATYKLLKNQESNA